MIPAILGNVRPLTASERQEVLPLPEPAVAANRQASGDPDPDVPLVPPTINWAEGARVLDASGETPG